MCLNSVDVFQHALIRTERQSSPFCDLKKTHTRLTLPGKAIAYTELVFHLNTGHCEHFLLQELLCIILIAFFGLISCLEWREGSADIQSYKCDDEAWGQKSVYENVCG